MAIWLNGYMAKLLNGYIFFRFTLHASRLTPHVSRLTPHASRFTSHASRLTPHASRLTLHVSRLTPHASRLTPHASRFTPHASRFTPHASRFTSHLLELPDLDIFIPYVTPMILENQVPLFCQSISGIIFPFSIGNKLFPFICP
jgi:hypothetical protein